MKRIVAEISQLRTRYTGSLASILASSESSIGILKIVSSLWNICQMATYKPFSWKETQLKYSDFVGCRRQLKGSSCYTMQTFFTAI